MLLVVVCSKASASNACCEAAEDSERSVPLQAKRLLFLGDSITNAGHYVAQIETQLRVQGLAPLPQLINVGLPSETCSGLSEPDHPFPRPNVHERLQRALDQVKPDVVVACYGMNDGIYYPFSEERFDAYQRGLQKLIDDVHAIGAKLVLLTPPPFDPVPLQDTDKLRPRSADKFAWFAIYKNYDQEVIRRYAEYVLSLADQVELVVDVHSPIREFLAEQRKQDPDFHIASDGVHIDARGHEVMAKTILNAWGVESWEPVSDELQQLLKQKEGVLHDAWLTSVGHKRPQTKVGLPLDEAEVKAAELEQQIRPLVQEAQRPATSKRRSSGGTVYSVHYPASLQPGELKLYVDYHLWIPDAVSNVRGVIVHQHGCGPGASIGGQTAADDLHWQELARRHDCALMGSSYEPRKGVNCRLWCDARRGSSDRFVQSLQHFSAASQHPELASAPWCLWGHSGGGFWASLMQTMNPERIVAIWLQSGTAFGYWQSGEIETPGLPEAAYGVPVIGCPGGKEKEHERFRRAWDGIAAMRDHFRQAGAPFFEFAPDPKTGHECGQSRDLAIPFFDFWLAERLSADGKLKDVDAGMLHRWQQSMSDRLDEFVRTGAVSDETPPPAPTDVAVKRDDQERATITWSASVDFESGLRGFIIERDGRPVATVPEQPNQRFGRALFQGRSYHDTPETPLPEMKWTDPQPPGDADVTYSVRSVNSYEQKSEPVKASAK